MSSLLVQFQNHILFQTLTNKMDEITKTLADTSYNELKKESLLAYHQILTIINANLKSNSLPMVPKTVLDGLNTAVANLSINVLTNINAYSSQYNALLDWYKRIPTLEKKSEIKESFNSLIDKFIRKQEQIKVEINNEIDSFQNRQEEQFESWATEKEKMQSEIDELREQNNELKSKIDSFGQIINKQQEKIENLISEFKTNYDENTENFENRFTEKEEEYNSQIDTLLTTQRDNANAILEHLEKRKNEVEKLWGIIGKSVTVGNASNNADEHKSFANTMMWWTFGLMTAGLLFIGIAIWKLLTNEYTYVNFVWKVITSAIILAPALYCANISKRQRDREFQLRDFEIKTAALEPFMENMILENKTGTQDINKDKIKLELTKTFFDKQFNAYGKNNDCIVLPKEIAKILNNLAKRCNLNINLGDKDEQNS